MTKQSKLSNFTDKELIKKAAKGDNVYFEEIVTKYQRKIYYYLLKFLNQNIEDAEDCTAETFLKVYTNLNKYKPRYSFSSWIYRIAHNEGVNLIRKKSKHYNVQNEILEAKAVDLNFDQPNLSDLETVLVKLKPADKNILILYYLEGWSLKEIADILKITVSNATTKLKRARDRAKKIT